MNWNKVLNVFIIIFLLINIALAYYQVEHRKAVYTLPHERGIQMQQVLNSKGIIIRDYIPNFYPKKKIELSMPQYDRKSMIENVIGKVYDSRIDGDSLGEIVSNADNGLGYDESLTFYTGEQEGYVYYHGEKSKYVPSDLTYNGVDEVAMKFAKDLFGDDVDMVVTYRTEVKNENNVSEGYSIEMNERFGREGDMIFQTFIKLYITIDGIKEALAIRYTPIDYTGPSQNIYPFDEAAYSFMYHIEDEVAKEEQGLSILHIDIGYYNIDIDVKKLSNVLEPHYRIITASGDVYYINAYTNVVVEP